MSKLKVFVKLTQDSFGRLATFPFDVTEETMVQDIKDEVNNKTGIPTNKMIFTCYFHGVKVYMVECEPALKFLHEDHQTIFTQLLEFEVTQVRSRTTGSVDMGKFYNKLGLKPIPTPIKEEDQEFSQLEKLLEAAKTGENENFMKILIEADKSLDEEQENLDSQSGDRGWTAFHHIA